MSSWKTEHQFDHCFLSRRSPGHLEMTAVMILFDYCFGLGSKQAVGEHSSDVDESYSDCWKPECSMHTDFKTSSTCSLMCCFIIKMLWVPKPQLLHSKAGNFGWTPWTRCLCLRWLLLSASSFAQISHGWVIFEFFKFFYWKFGWLFYWENDWENEFKV